MQQDDAPFDPMRKYGCEVVGDPEACEELGRRYLPAGTPFKVLKDVKGGVAWYYSPDGKIPNPHRVTCIKECVA